MKKLPLYFLILLAGLALLGWVIFKNYIDAEAIPQNAKDLYLEIPTGSSFEEVVAILQSKNFIQNEVSFRRLADYMRYERAPMRPGRFKVQPGWSNIRLIKHLRRGEQATVKVVLNNERLLEDVAKKVSRFIEPTSTEILDRFKDKNTLKMLGFTEETLMSVFIPNTYELYWNTTPEAFLKRMKKEHDRFWDQNNRLKKATKIKLTPEEVYTLASIVEKETRKGKEKPRIAGVYLNRLEQNIRLQADPTAVFATREFNVRRVLKRHTRFDSPYNTYRYAGLPPGPISMASIESLDAVLNAEQHDYIYFCARGDASGLHSFAKTLAGHNRNVSKYKRNLRKRGIR